MVIKKIVNMFVLKRWGNKIENCSSHRLILFPVMFFRMNALQIN